MKLRVELAEKTWPLKEPFVISRAVHLDAPTLHVRLVDDEGRVGRGEAYGVSYLGETPVLMAEQIQAVLPSIEQGLDVEALRRLLPHGGARFALDAALWDLRAEREATSAFALAGLEPRPVVTGMTIGIRSLEAYEQAAARYAGFATLKVKVNAEDPVACIRAVRRGAPAASLIVDPNQAWSVDQLRAWAPAMADLGVGLLEQPIPVGAEAGLDGYAAPLPLCADELINDEADLDRAAGRFSHINIKLDKAGGLTTALGLARRAQDAGFRLMVGNMGGSSLAMAPAMVIAQLCDFIDLDGPLMQSADIEDGFVYVDGVVEEPWNPRLWG